VHIDGFIAQVAHTVVLGADAEAKPVTGPAADVTAAAYAAAEIACRLVKAGNKNTQVTEAIEKVAAAYGVTPLAGMASHQLKQFVIDGEKVIALKADPEAKPRIEEVTFEAGEAYSIDIAFSSGEGKPRETEARTTIFKRVLDNNYQLKMKASRWVIHEVSKRFPALPFTIRALGDDTQSRLGVVECMKHSMLGGYQVLYEREGAHVAHVKYTVLLLPSGTAKVTGLPCPAYIKSDKKREWRRVRGLTAPPLLHRTPAAKHRGPPVLVFSWPNALLLHDFLRPPSPPFFFPDHWHPDARPESRNHTAMVSVPEDLAAIAAQDLSSGKKKKAAGGAGAAASAP
jgi:curved DNA binding protein